MPVIQWLLDSDPSIRWQVLTIAGLGQPPGRFLAGADAVGIAEQKAADLLAQAEVHRALSTSLARDNQ